MKKIFLFSAILICTGFCYIWGQNDSEELKKQINKIKKSQSYLSAEATLPNEEEALKIANELLVEEINSWVKSKRDSDKVQQIVLQDISSCTAKMNMKRGANVRAFVYVKKSDIVLIKGDAQIILNDNEQGNELQALSEISEPMKFEKPSKKDKTENSEAKEMVNQKETSLKAIMEAKNMTNMKTVFSDLKDKNAISYGAYPSAEASGEHYLLFYARSGEVKAVVSVNGNTLTDLYTQQEVKLSDYSGHGAYWFKLK